MFDVCLLFSTKPGQNIVWKKNLEGNWTWGYNVILHVITIHFPQTIKANGFSLSKVQGPPQTFFAPQYPFWMDVLKQ
jgi:hypothetical protein